MCFTTFSHIVRCIYFLFVYHYSLLSFHWITFDGGLNTNTASPVSGWPLRLLGAEIVHSAFDFWEKVRLEFLKMQVESWRMEIFEMGFCFVLVMHVFDCYAIYHSC